MELAVAVALGLAIGADGIPVIGIPIILAICLWYVVHNGRFLFPALLRDRLAMLLLALFAAIALKDGLFLLAGSGSLKAFAKSASRILVIAGVAVMVHSHDRRHLERMYLIATGAGASIMGMLFLLMRAGILPWFLNENSFGMIAIWFPLGVLALWHREYARARVGSASPRDTIPPPGIQAAFAGFMLLVFLLDAFVLEPRGSRTALLAFILALLIGILPGLRCRTRLTILLLVLVSAVLLLITLQPDPRSMELLANRPRLWRAFFSMALKRPFVGWGWTDASDNLRLVTPLVEKDIRYADIATIGYGPHNSLLALAFENGFLAAILFLTILIVRIYGSRTSTTIFDPAIPAWIIFASFDAILPGGITALGFLLSWIILAHPSRFPDTADPGGPDTPAVSERAASRTSG